MRPLSLNLHTLIANTEVPESDAVSVVLLLAAEQLLQMTAPPSVPRGYLTSE